MKIEIDFPNPTHDMIVDWMLKDGWTTVSTDSYSTILSSNHILPITLEIPKHQLSDTIIESTLKYLNFGSTRSQLELYAEMVSINYLDLLDWTLGDVMAPSE